MSDDKKNQEDSDFKEVVDSGSRADFLDKLRKNIPSDPERTEEAIKYLKEHKRTYKRYLNRKLRGLRLCRERLVRKYFFWTDAYQTRHPSHPKPKYENNLESKVE